MFDQSHRAGDPVDPSDVLSSIREVVYAWDIGSDELRWGPNAGEVLRNGRLDTGLAFARLVEPGLGRSRYDAIMEATGADNGDGVPYRTRYAMLVGDRTMWAEDTGRWFGGVDGGPARARGVLRLERAVTEADLAGPSFLVSDRATLLQRLDELMADQMPANRSVVVLACAIDDLASLNSDFGHEATDEVLREVQTRICAVMRRRDRLVRYASNRFAIILTGCPAARIAIAARRFVRAVSRDAIRTQRGLVLARMRVGAAHAPDLTRHPGELLSAAEAALVEARSGQVEAILQARALAPKRASGAEAADDNAIAALNDRRIRLALQPVVQAASRQVAFHEALVRIGRPDGGYFAPGDLLPALERRGLVRLFDHRVLELAAESLDAVPGLRLSLNVSPVSMADPVWLDAFHALLGGQAGLAPRVIVEVTETAAIANERESLAVIRQLKDAGCRVAIDDFGAGHTSLRHLRSFPIDILKLDGAFSQNLSRSTDDRFFVRTLLDLAAHLKVETVAEWVDSEAAAQMLTEWGVTYLQGNLTGEARLMEPLALAAA